jgi:hypothetical protein
MPSVFVLQHAHELPDGSEAVKFIGVYSSRPSAEAAIRRLEPRVGFAETANGFSIDEYEIDRDNWIEGFVTQ